jgi:hypothetical protein
MRISTGADYLKTVSGDRRNDVLKDPIQTMQPVFFLDNIIRSIYLMMETVYTIVTFPLEKWSGYLRGFFIRITALNPL